MAAKPRRLEVRHSQTFNMTLAAIGMVLLAIAGLYGLTVALGQTKLPGQSPWLLLICASALLYYVVRSILRFRNRKPQLVVDRDGIHLGFGRDMLVPWESILWVRVRGIRPALQLGVSPEHFTKARVSLWNLDDNLASVAGGGPAIAVRAAGLDTSMRSVLEMIHAWKPSLRPPR